jgi:hypothetical protein
MAVQTVFGSGEANMRNLPQVEEAKSVMRQAMEWSVVRWLKEKRRVRKLADRANAALDELDREIKGLWPADLQAAYLTLTQARGTPPPRGEGQPAEFSLALRIKRADDSAARARAQAEKTFDQAEDELSARLAREGCLQAIQSWELHEQAIRLAESATKTPAWIHGT